MDFTEPPSPVDGCYPLILAVRDLASGELLLSLPTPDKSDGTVRDALLALFIEHGAPLVLKSDNASSFKASEVGDLLDEWGILRLLSPPRLPKYNGACEAGIGGLKVRAHFESSRNGRPGEWTCDDVEGARLMANETARPHGERGPTPDQAWRRRRVISSKLRREFNGRVIELRKEVRQERGWLPGVAVGVAEQETIDRIAVSRALVEHGLLEFRRRWITHRVKAGSCAKIS